MAIYGHLARSKTKNELLMTKKMEFQKAPFNVVLLFLNPPNTVIEV